MPELKGIPFAAYNCVVSNWDNTPRSGRRGTVFTGSTPALFGQALQKAVDNLREVADENSKDNFIFLKSWNEWAEGNYVEPDQIHGRAYLEEIQKVIKRAGDF